MEFYRLVKLGHWHDARHGDCIVRRGQVLPHVLMISKGNASVLDTYVVFSLSLSLVNTNAQHTNTDNRDKHVEYSYVAADLIDNHFSVDENCVIGGT